jgi:hypothetical protein
MATAQITFDLSNHDDRMDMARYQASLDMAIYIFEILNNGHRKFDSEEANKVFKYLHEEARDQGIDIDKLIE